MLPFLPFLPAKIKMTSPANLLAQIRKAISTNAVLCKELGRPLNGSGPGAKWQALLEFCLAALGRNEPTGHTQQCTRRLEITDGGEVCWRVIDLVFSGSDIHHVHSPDLPRHGLPQHAHPLSCGFFSPAPQNSPALTQSRDLICIM